MGEGDSYPPYPPQGTPLNIFHIYSTVRVSTKDSKTQKSVHVVYGWPYICEIDKDSGSNGQIHFSIYSKLLTLRNEPIVVCFYLYINFNQNFVTDLRKILLKKDIAYFCQSASKRGIGPTLLQSHCTVLVL